MTINELFEKTGYTQTGFARVFNIPLRTVQDWAAGKHTPPEYIPAIIDELLTLRNGERLQRFFVISGSYDADLFGGNIPFETYEEAEQEAMQHWHHLTESERAKIPVFHIARGAVEYSDGFPMIENNYDVVRDFK